MPRWKRWSTCGAAALVGLAAVSAATQDQTDSPPLAAATTEVPPTTITADTPPTAPPPASDPTSAPAPATAPTTIAPTSTAPPAVTPPTVPGSLLALDVLATIPVEREQPDGYDRDRFRYGDTVDAYGCRTRARVLMRDSLTPAQVDAGGCAVVAGDWLSRYDGITWSDPAEVEIDHVVALKEAWDSGAWAWDDARLTAFGNDIDDVRTLVVVTGAENTAKGEKDPSNWIPPNADVLCAYVADWTAIKARWGLSMDESEFGRIRNLLSDRCPGQTVAPWVPVSEIVPVATVPPATVAPPVVAPTQPPPPVFAVPPTNCDPSYPTLCIRPGSPDLDCGDISERRFPVLPPDPHGFDGNDDDGVGCES